MPTPLGDNARLSSLVCVGKIALRRRGRVLVAIYSISLLRSCEGCEGQLSSVRVCVVFRLLSSCTLETFGFGCGIVCRTHSDLLRVVKVLTT